jgi:phytoene desaturase
MKANQKKAIVIGAGFSGLSAAAYLAKDGYAVTLLEKNEQAGGRARVFSTDGFRFDMGPSWYWMPDVFDRFFADFQKSTAAYYTLERLSPSYRVFFPQQDIIDVPDRMEAIEDLFEKLEPGSKIKLQQFLREAQYKYEVGMQDLVQKPGNHIFEFADIRVLKGLFRLHLLTPFSTYIRRYFTHPYLLQLLEFPILFLGAQPKDIPALYSLMNYADMQLGTWYPKQGMGKIVEGMVSLIQELGVTIHYNEEVIDFTWNKNAIQQVITTKGTYDADVVIGAADYHHIEQELLPQSFRQYSPSYWDKRTLAPSCLLYYVGLNKKIEGLLHHNLFFDTDFSQHAHEIYSDAAWPRSPLFYISVTSKTDKSVAPENGENLFILIPVAPGLKDNPQIHQQYFEMVMQRLETRLQTNIRDHVVYRKDYGYQNFVNDYHSFKGNAYGLANTLQQTAILKPKMKSKKVKNLYYTGQLTVPGPGVPPSLISGKIVAQLIHNNH